MLHDIHLGNPVLHTDNFARRTPRYRQLSHNTRGRNAQSGVCVRQESETH